MKFGVSCIAFLLGACEYLCMATSVKNEKALMSVPSSSILQGNEGEYEVIKRMHVISASSKLESPSGLVLVESMPKELAVPPQLIAPSTQFPQPRIDIGRFIPPSTTEEYLPARASGWDTQFQWSGKLLGRGAQGEVLLACRLQPELPPERNIRALRSGGREAFFGGYLAHSPYVSTLIESFFVMVDHDADDSGSDDIQDADLYLVFPYKGAPLHHFLFEAQGSEQDAEATDHTIVSIGPDGSGDGKCHSRCCTRDGPLPLPRTTAHKQWESVVYSPQGAAAIQVLFRELVAAVASIHAQDVVHRDIKAQNILLAFDPPHAPETLKVVIIDFGSALCVHPRCGGLYVIVWSRRRPCVKAMIAFRDNATEELYGPEGPSHHDLTLSMVPPEVWLSMLTPGKELPISPHNPKGYDTWSLALLLVEAVSGTPIDEFLIMNSRTERRIIECLRDSDSTIREYVLFAAKFATLCLAVPQPGMVEWVRSQTRETSMSQRCESVFASLTKQCSPEAAFTALRARMEFVGRQPPHVLTPLMAETLYDMLQWESTRRPSLDVVLRKLQAP